MAPTRTSEIRRCGRNDNCPAAVVIPVPLRDTLGLFEALLVNESDPETVPVALGVKDTLSVLLCPAEIVTGKEVPTKANSKCFYSASRNRHSGATSGA